jgi:hypothetical protein
MTTAEYFRSWRAAHPDYRRREVARTARRRAAGGRDSRATEYRNRARADARAGARRREAEAIPPLHTGHLIFDLARELVGPSTSGLTVFLDPLHEDLLSEAVVALVAGADPADAVRRFRSSEHAWRRVTAPMVAEVAA